MSSGKTKKNKGKRKQPQARKKAAQVEQEKIPTWEEIAQYPPVLFTTLGRGVIIGFIGGASESAVRVYAPAAIQEAPPSNVLFLPLFPIESFMDLRQACIFSSSPIPPILLKGYLGYFEQFAKGSYRMNPVVISAGIDAPEGEHIVSGVPEDPTEEPLPDPLQAVPEPAPETVEDAPAA